MNFFAVAELSTRHFSTWDLFPKSYSPSFYDPRLQIAQFTILKKARVTWGIENICTR